MGNSKTRRDKLRLGRTPSLFPGAAGHSTGTASRGSAAIIRLSRWVVLTRHRDMLTRHGPVLGLRYQCGEHW